MTKEGYSEMGLGREYTVAGDIKRIGLDELPDVNAMREAFLSDSPYKGELMESVVAYHLIESGALRVVAKNLDKFPVSEHEEIIAALSETEEGREILGL